MGLAEQARTLRRHPSLEAAARFGLASRVIVYATLCLLVIQLATGDRRRDTDQSSGIRVLGQTVAGRVLLILLIAGVACYALWRCSVAAVGTRAEPDRRARLLALVEAVAYLPFAYMAIGVLTGNNNDADQSRTYRSLSGQLMRHDAGRVLVGAVGVAVVVVGGFLTYQGVRQTFRGKMRLDDIPCAVRRSVVVLGVLGSTGRGVIFGLAGALAIYAAVTASPSDAGGVDAALDTVAGQPVGPALLLLAAVCFGAFALFAVAEARWRHT